MRYVLIALFVFIGPVMCINKTKNSDQSVVQGKYNFNHPPSAENNNQIPPVTVVQEDDVIAEKLRKLENEDNTKPNANLEEVNHNTKENKQPIISERIETSTVVPKSVKDSEKEDLYVKSKTRVLSELQIPVAVVYDDVPISTQIPRRAKPNKTNIPRSYNKLRSNKQNEFNTEKEKLMNQNTEPAKLQSQSVGTNKPRTQNGELVKPQPRRLESVKPEPLKAEPVRQNPSSTETHAKVKETKRERAPFVPIIESENNVYAHSGNFHYSYEGGDGTKAHSEGRLRNVNDKAAGEAVSGGFSYTDNEGNDFSLSYTADEKGYRPVGAHLPTPPPIPPAIARALAYLATATTPEPVTKPTVQKT